MPTPVELLWTSIKNKEFGGVKALITENAAADLVNAKHPENGRTLPLHLLQVTMNTKEAKPRELLQFLLSHPKMDWTFVSKIKQTPMSSLVESVIADDDLSVIESLKDVDGFIYNNGKLAYEWAMIRQKDLENTLASRIEKRRPQKEIDMARLCLDRCKKAVALIRDITILHALKTDNDTLLELLDKAGGEPQGMLGNFGGKKLMGLLIGVGQQNPKIKAWDKAKDEQASARAAENRKALEETLRRYDFFKAKQAEIDAEHDARALAILKRAGEERKERMTEFKVSVGMSG